MELQSAPYFEWTAEQADALESLRAFLAGPPGVFVLAGYAGTGKTTLVVEALRSARIPPRRKDPYTNEWSGGVAFTAPTHKAVGVLHDRGDLAGAKYRTLHSLLGCTQVLDSKTGERNFKPNPDKSQWGEFAVIVIDEVSMVGVTMWGWIQDANTYIEEHEDGSATDMSHRHVICMGDPAQLPPVNDGDGLSPAFRHTNAQLTEVVRSAGIVLQAATSIRCNLAAPIPVSVALGTDQCGTVEVLEKEDFMTSAVMDFTAGIDAKILAWTNDAVNFVNEQIREIIFGEDAPPDPQVGELLVVVRTWSGGDYSHRLHAEQEILVHECEAGEHLDIPVWKIKALRRGHAEHYIATGQPVDPLAAIPLLMVRPDGAKAMRDALSRYRHEVRKGGMTWRDFYYFKDQFIELRPGYATTVHKSQGSTYHTAYVIDRNLRRCPDAAVRNMLRYVAFSRASKRLVIG